MTYVFKGKKEDKSKERDLIKNCVRCATWCRNHHQNTSPQESYLNKSPETSLTGRFVLWRRNVLRTDCTHKENEENCRQNKTFGLKIWFLLFSSYNFFVVSLLLLLTYLDMLPSFVITV